LFTNKLTKITMAADQYENEEHRIQEKFKQKTWNEIRTNDSWAIFKNHVRIRKWL